MNTQVLLLNAPITQTGNMMPERPYFPLSLLFLAAHLRAHSIDVRIQDMQVLYSRNRCSDAAFSQLLDVRLPQITKAIVPDIFGIGCLFSGAFKNSILIARKLKQLFPGVPTAIGGIHATVFSREILQRFASIDYVVIGEGEESFLALVRALRDNRSCDHIDGIAYRHRGEVKVNAKTRFIDDLDSLPDCDYSLVDLQHYRPDTSKWYSPMQPKIGQPFPLITSRSCPNRCTFCSMWLVHGPRIRFRSAQRVLAEMEHLYHAYGARFFECMDDNMTFDKQRTLALCEGIHKRNLKIQFSTPNGLAVKTLDEETVDALVGAGLIRVSLAIESGSPYIRNTIMRKGLSNDTIYRVLASCAKHAHLYITGYFIIGMPEETEKTLADTYAMMTSLPLDNVNVFFATPYPGTELFDTCLRRNLLPYSREDYVTVRNLHYAAHVPHFEPTGVKQAELIAFREKCRQYFQQKRQRLGRGPNLPLRA